MLRSVTSANASSQFSKLNQVWQISGAQSCSLFLVSIHTRVCTPFLLVFVPFRCRLSPIQSHLLNRSKLNSNAFTFDDAPPDPNQSPVPPLPWALNVVFSFTNTFFFLNPIFLWFCKIDLCNAFVDCKITQFSSKEQVTHKSHSQDAQLLILEADGGQSNRDGR